MTPSVHSLGEGQDGALLDEAAAAGLPLPQAGAQVHRTKEAVGGPAAPRDAEHPQHDAQLPAVGVARGREEKKGTAALIRIE